MKVADLKEECEKRGLENTGKKAELVSRLQAASTGMTKIIIFKKGGTNNNYDSVEFIIKREDNVIITSC